MGTPGQFGLTAWGRTNPKGRNANRRSAEDIRRLAELRKEKSEPLNDIDLQVLVKKLYRK